MSNPPKQEAPEFHGCKPQLSNTAAIIQTLSSPHLSPGSKSRRSALFSRSFTKSFPIAARGEGVWLWDKTGKKYLDFCGSAAVNFIGHGVLEIAEAMAEQGGKLEFAHTSQFITEVAEQFAQEILQFAGESFRGGAVYFTCGGSEAVETALKLARQYQLEVGHRERYQIISRRQSYHGATLGALAVSGNVQRREIYLPMMREFEHIGIPYCYRCAYDCKNCAQAYAQELAQALDRNRNQVAGFIFEPVSGATLGAAVPPDGYLQRVAEICRENHLLLIADEVMTGFGRTGSNFAVEHWRVAPDILVCAKGIASGYAPLGAVIANARVVEALASGSGAFTHGLTYNAHPVAVAAGRAVLRYVREQKLVAAAAARASTMRKRLEGLRDLAYVGDVRGIGLLWGVEFVADKSRKQPFDSKMNFANRVAQQAFQRGLLVYPIQGCVDGYSGDHVLIAPPAVIKEEQISWAVERLHEAIEAAETEVTSGI
jgi:adenosylmethionine-8-amino-7-oxononanoate aminotransferase